MSKTRSVCRPYLYFFLLILLAGCGHKEEAQKDEGQKDAEHKVENKKEEVERSTTIVAHLRLDLDHELREEATPLVLPEKTEEISQPKPAGKEKVIPAAQLPDEDTRYKTDKEYLALRQFVQPVRNEGTKAPVKEKIGKDEAGTIQARDRVLALGGKGFGLQGTDSKDLSIDTTRYLEDIPPPAPPKKETETLDLREGEVRNKRSLIFHEQGGGFFKVDEPEEKVKAKEVKAPKVAPPPSEKIPETRILLSQDKGKELVLLPKDREIDLLMGSEDVNRKVFGNR